MHDLEQSAERLVRDWKTLRHRLEYVHQEQPLRQFLTMHLDVIEARLAEVPDLVYSIVSDAQSPCAADGAPATAQPGRHLQQSPSRGGLAARIRQTRQAVDYIDMDE